MPVLAGGLGSKYAATSFVDARGKKATVRADNLPGTATPAQITAYQTAMGNLSNAGIFKEVSGGSTDLAIPAATAFDEAESSVTTGANFTFQNTTTLQTRSFRVPAIDMDAVDPSGNFVEAARDATGLVVLNAQVDAMIAACLAMLGAGWVYVNAPISTHARGVVQGTERPIVAEPGAGDLPADAPAV